MSAGELFDLVMPAALVLSALISTWVLASARKRFALPFAVALAVATLFLPLIVFPLYLALMMWRRPTRRVVKWRYALPLIYALVVLSGIATYYYFDMRSVDAHLARASRAKLLEHTHDAIREYQAALAIENDPHTHKLLAIELAKADYLLEAVAEFRLAQRGGEPDDSISYSLGLLLERLNLTDQAALEFQKFVASETCQKPDARCDDARKKLDAVQR